MPVINDNQSKSVSTVSKDVSNTKSDDQSSISYAQKLGIAAAGGQSAALTAFLFEGTKKRIQSGQSLPSLSKLGPLGWVRESFRGVSSFSGSLVPTCMLQTTVEYQLKQRNLTDTQAGKVAENLISGAAGGFASTLVENIILSQQLNKTGPAAAIKNLLAEGPTRPFRGLPLIAGREAVFGFCYMKGATEAGNYAANHYGEAYVMPAKLAVGIAGSIVSQPFDTMATTMQTNGYRNSSSAVKHLWQEKGSRAFFSGGLARVGLFTTAMLTIEKVTQAGIDQCEKFNTEQAMSKKP